ncbi:MAG: hypothetical protein CSA07_00250 [Bacteroidia bacterium]|nr:MAG: hypothetical protein CSA07_00250 [Bacteroidia bacterium]
MNKNGFSWKRVMVFAGSYVATIIGSGFATGQEIMQFFSFYGLAGIAGSLISMGLFIFLGVELLNRGRLVKPKDPMSIFKLYTGRYIGIFLDWFVPLFLFAVFVVMISGAGATLTEYYGLHPYIGRVGMAVLAYLAISLGLEKLSNVLGYIGPTIIVFTVLIGLIGTVSNLDGLDAALAYIETAEVSKPVSNPYFAGALYTAYNAIIVVGILASLGATTDNRREAVYGGIIGAVALMGTATLLLVAIMSQAPVLFGREIPTLVLADQISPLVGKLFSVILLLGIFSTAAPLLWQFAARFTKDGTKGFRIFSLLATVAGLAGGFLPFDRLVGTVYPYTGYLGILIIIIIAYKSISLAARGASGREELEAIESGKAT